MICTGVVLDKAMAWVHQIKFFYKDQELYVALYDDSHISEFWISNIKASDLGITKIPDNFMIERKYRTRDLNIPSFEYSQDNFLFKVGDLVNRFVKGKSVPGVSMKNQMSGDTYNVGQIEPRTVTYNNYFQGAQVGNFANEQNDNAQQTTSNFTQNNNTQLPQLIDELRHVIEALPTEIQETINIDLDDIAEELNKIPDQRNSQRLKHRLQSVGDAIHKAGTLLKDPGDIARAITSLTSLANLCHIHLPHIF